MRIFSTCSILMLSAMTYLSAQNTLPANMYADSAHAPFYYGVAAGDPSTDALIIWTHIRPSSPDSVSLWVDWELASDSLFSNIVQSGTAQTDSSINFTVNVDVSGLAAGSSYYYRFRDSQGHLSIWGRGKTLPTGPIVSSKIAVMSCSSIFSGFFNAYRRLSERDDLQLILHLGDYVYDFVDADEQVRIPTPFPIEPSNRKEWVDRHQYYLLDPDLREARRMQTWVAIWDNHDLDRDSISPKEIFRQWLPIRASAAAQQNLLYRKLSIGDLVDIQLTDVESLRRLDSFPNGEAHLMGFQQFDSICTWLKNSDATWRLIGSQKMAGGWFTHGIDPGLLNLVPNDGPVFDNSSWDGFLETRKRLFDTISTYSIDNCMMLSGDAHITLAMDLVKDPYDSLSYDPVTGTGALGTEFLASSISRGNFDEQGVPTSLSAFFMNISLTANPHHQYMEINSHGYGLLEINGDSIIATPYYSDILSISSVETPGISMIMVDGENHWKRQQTTALTETDSPKITFYPNPANSYLYVQTAYSAEDMASLHFYDVLGRACHSVSLLGNSEISTSALPNGFYALVLVANGKKWVVEKLCVQH